MGVPKLSEWNLMMNKVMKNADELHKLIVEKLRENTEFNSVTPSKPYEHERDAQGCNWDLQNWKGDITDVRAAKKYLLEFVNLVRDKYDLAS